MTDTSKLPPMPEMPAASPHYCGVLGLTASDMAAHSKAYGLACYAAGRRQGLDETLRGWKIERKDSKPFLCIHVIAPNGWGAVVQSHDRNPENVLYMLADALLQTRGKNDSGVV